jgi:hypothetical protein
LDGDETDDGGAEEDEEDSGGAAHGKPSALQLATSECIARACATLRAQLAEARAEARDRTEEAEARARELRALADSIGKPSQSHGDVTFRCADGAELGASRFVLVRTCPYYRALFESSSAEARTGLVHADPDFSSGSHAALLRQLLSLGEAELPADAGELLELLRLAVKLQPPLPPNGSSSGAAQASVLGRVRARCEAAMLGALSQDNCLEVLLHAKSEGCGSTRLLQEAELFAKALIGELASTPRWEQFRAGFPSEAAALLGPPPGVGKASLPATPPRQEWRAANWTTMTMVDARLVRRRLRPRR